MKLKIILIILLTCSFVSNGVVAQTIEGEWYTPLRNKLLHITISRDSVLFRKCNFNIEKGDYGYVDMAFRIEKKIDHNYIVSGIKDTVRTYYLLNFKLEKGRNNLNIGSLNSKFFTLTEAEDAIKLVEQPPMNIVLINKQSIDKIRQKKDIKTMEANDFKNYALIIAEQDSINRINQKQKYKLSYLYMESTGRIILSELGFNSLVKGNVFDSMLEKFAANPETKEFFLKMTGSRK